MLVIARVRTGSAAALLVLTALTALTGCSSSRPSVEVTPETVRPGDDVRVTAENFGAGERAFLGIDGTPNILVHTDEDGALDASLVVPADLPAGSYQVGLSDETHNIARATLTVASGPGG